MAHCCFSCAMVSRAGAPLHSGHRLVRGRGAPLEDNCCAGCLLCAACLPLPLPLACPACACCLPALAAPDEEEEEEEKKPKTKKVTETITEWKALNDNQVCARKGISTRDQLFERTGHSLVQST